ncbi:hypothetical protein LEP3755_07830 [Leptolyngbya sp. NIES-3755]|nr:hypothetical protein LEP3755_07830 [Leptolyngbya sp. NIES-3755]
MTLYILDTDHLSLIQRRHPIASECYKAHNPKQLFITAVTAEEQLRGRLTVVHQTSQQPTKLIAAYANLLKTLTDLQALNVLTFDEIAAQHFQRLRQAKLRIGTQDLRIASIALGHSAILVTRNRRDFLQVPDLILEDWTI